MNYVEFLNGVIDGGIAAATRDYSKPHQQSVLEGSVAGFEACRNLAPHQLKELLVNMRDAYSRACGDRAEVDAYWRLRGIAAEIEWVCNCVSAMLVNEGFPPIIVPTARGALNAARVLGQARVLQ